MVNDFVNCVPLLYFSQLCGIRPLLKKGGVPHPISEKQKTKMYSYYSQHIMLPSLLSRLSSCWRRSFQPFSRFDHTLGSVVSLRSPRNH